MEKILFPSYIVHFYCCSYVVHGSAIHLDQSNKFPDPMLLLFLQEMGPWA